MIVRSGGSDQSEQMNTRTIAALLPCHRRAQVTLSPIHTSATYHVQAMECLDCAVEKSLQASIMTAKSHLKHPFLHTWQPCQGKRPSSKKTSV